MQKSRKSPTLSAASSSSKTPGVYVCGGVGIAQGVREVTSNLAPISNVKQRIGKGKLHVYRNPIYG